jgi:hypothetical protein
MKTITRSPRKIGDDFFERLWEKSWTYIKTVVDVVREPILILDKDFHVMAANNAFYDTFNTNKKATENTLVYKLGNGQWDIPELRKLLESILPKHTFFKGFQVAHEFPSIGRKVMILNARQIHIIDEDAPGAFPPIILLAMEDVTEMMVVAESLANHANKIEANLLARTHTLELHIGKLARELSAIKKKK